MADTKTTKILEVVVDNNKAVTAISEYNRLIDEQKAKQAALAKAYADGKISQADYYKAMAQSKEVTKTYSRQVQELSKEVQNNIKMDTEKARSLRALRAELSNVTKQYDELSEEERKAAKGMELQAKIQDITSQLKNSEQETGRFYRNVGNYANGFVEAFTRMGGSAAGLQGPLNMVKNGFTAISTTPLITILGALVTVIQKVIQNLKSSEASMNAVAVAMAPLNAGGRLLQRVLQSLGEVIVVVANKLAEWADKLGLVTEAMKTEQQLVKDEIALGLREREVLVENAESQLKISKLKAQAADKSNLSARERVDILREAVAEEEKIAKRELELAQERLRIQEESAKLAANSKEENDALAQSRAEVLRAEQAYFDKTRELQAQIVEAENAAKSEMNAAVKARIEAEKDLIDQELQLSAKGSEERLKLEKASRTKEYELAVQSVKSSIKDKTVLNKTLLLMEQSYLKDLDRLDIDHQRAQQEETRKAMQNRVDSFKEGSKEQLAAAVVLRKHELDTLAKLEEESEADYQARRIAAQKAYDEAERAMTDAALERARQSLENKMNAFADGTIDRLKAEIDLRKYELESITQLAGESDEAFYARKLAAQKAYNEASKALLDEETRQQVVALENQMNEYAAGSLAQMRAEVELRKYELDTLHQMEEESDADFYARKLAAQKAYNDSKKSLAAEELDIATTTAQAVGGLANSLGELIMQMAGENKKAAQLAQKLALAQIAIETGVATAKGISAAIAAGPFPANLAAIATTIATVLSGITQAVASVKSAKFSTGGYVRGAGTSTSDSIPAMLSNGESVINAKSTAMFGPLLSSLNQAGGGVGFNPATSGQREGYEFLAAAVAAGMEHAKLSVGVDEITRVQGQVDKIKQISTIQ